MSSVWNVVRSVNYDAVSGSENCDSPANSPVPDKFNKKMTVNSLRMSIRKRMPLKRINVNGVSPDYYRKDIKKQKGENAKMESAARTEKPRSIAVETSMKKTFYKMTEQLTGAAKKQQLKETPQKSTPRTRYRERLMSPPDTPASPVDPFDSPCNSTPLGKVKSLKRYTRTPASGGSSGRRLGKSTPQKERKSDSDDFSRHLELVSCGIQHLETNSNRMLAAISNIGLGYESSPLQPKMKGRGRLWKDEVKRYTPLSPQNTARPKKDNNDNTQSSSFTRGMLRRTMTRMSLRVKNRPSLRSTKSASNIEANCYNGPMSSEPKKLASLQEYSARYKKNH